MQHDSCDLLDLCWCTVLLPGRIVARDRAEPEQRACLLSLNLYSLPTRHRPQVYAFVTNLLHLLW